MSRTLVSEQELLLWMNGELQRNEDTTDCKFIGVYKLKATDSEGCNWSDPFVECSGVSADVHRGIVAGVVADARSRFNLK